MSSIEGVVAPLVHSPNLTGAELAAGSATELTPSVSGTSELSTNLAIRLVEGGSVSVPVLATACVAAAAVMDADGDSWTSCGGDCDDGASGVHLGIDDNCDGRVDE